MIRFVALLVMVIAAGSFGIGSPQAESSIGNQEDVDSLKEQRVQLLQDRVAVIKKWVDLGRAGTSDLIRPEMDVINAQLEYADTKVERKELLSELLIKYDTLIERAEIRTEEPARPDSDNSNHQMLAESELLHLKSERIRIQILHDTLE